MINKYCLLINNYHYHSSIGSSIILTNSCKFSAKFIKSLTFISHGLKLCKSYLFSFVFALPFKRFAFIFWNYRDSFLAFYCIIPLYYIIFPKLSSNILLLFTKIWIAYSDFVNLDLSVIKDFNYFDVDEIVETRDTWLTSSLRYLLVFPDYLASEIADDSLLLSFWLAY